MTNPIHFDPRPVILDGRHARLIPLTLSHTEDLFHAGQDDSIWRYMPCPVQKTAEETRRWIVQALAAQESGTEIPFTIVCRSNNQMIGSTRYLDIQRNNHGLEIGWTWIAPGHQGTRINAECKLLLMTHAFETQGAVRIQLKTDARNIRSQKAMEKLGCIREGVLRKSRFCWDHHYRDTVYYSVLKEEWPEVKEKIIQIIGKESDKKPV